MTTTQLVLAIGIPMVFNFLIIAILWHDILELRTDFHALTLKLCELIDALKNAAEEKENN